MNPITKALDEVFFRIPREILNVVFVEPYKNYRDIPADAKDKINHLVLRQRVLVDCNLVGGVEVRIPLDTVPAENVDGGYTTIYRVPKTMTNGRSISAVLDVTYGSLYQNLGGYGTNTLATASPAMQLGAAVMNAQLRTPYVGTGRVELIGENVVMVQDSIILPANLFVRCVLENDDTMSNIQVRSYHVFAKLVELAVKSFIYTNYVIRLDMGELRGGLQIGRFKEIVDGYADAETMYQEYLNEKWRKTAFMNDKESMQRFVALLVGGTR